MSPTSYQAAPPRTTTIADADAPVKLQPVKAEISANSRKSLPGVVRGAVQRSVSAVGMQVSHTGVILVRTQHHIVEHRHPVGLMRHGIDGNRMQILRLQQIIE